MGIVTLDIGGTSIRGAIIQDGKVIERATLPSPVHEGKSAVVSQIDSVLSTINLNGVNGIGISMAGPADYKSGIFQHPTNLPLHGFNIKRYLERKYHLPVRCENDARCFALGELNYGIARKMKNIVGITLGTGVGFGIIIDRKPYAGRSNAGEISKNTLVVDAYSGSKGYYPL